MSLIQRYEIKKDNNEYILVIHLDPGMEEFSRELGQLNNEKSTLTQQIINIARDHFPKININKVKVIDLVGQATPLSTLFIDFVDEDGTVIKRVEQQIDITGIFNFDILVNDFINYSIVVRQSDYAGNMSEAKIPVYLSWPSYMIVVLCSIWSLLVI